jgi:hypothetical protein
MDTWTLADLPEWVRPNVTEFVLSGCWVVGPGNGIRIDRDGYARRGAAGVHRLIYTELVGEIPDDRPVLDHVEAWGCIFRSCAYPGHLEPVTVRENTMRGHSFAVTNAAKDECDHGHPFDVANTYHWRGSRICRTCDRRRGHEYRQRLRAGRRTLAVTADLEIAA